MSWEMAKQIFKSPWVKELWAAFEIQVLVLTSLLFQIVLAVCGGRRKYKLGVLTRLLVWFSYLMGIYVATVSLGKLTDTNNDTIALNSISYGDAPKVNVTSNELRAMWAPLLLVHIGGPDSITAFAVEDNRLGLRQFLELGVQITVVGLIFIKSWNNSWLSIIALTLLVSGAIKSLERVWSLRCSATTEPVFGNLADSKALEIGTHHFLSSTKALEVDRLWSLKSSIPDLLLLVKAYIRFEHLKPHLQNWIGHPLSIQLPSMSTYYSTPIDTFKIAEAELSFMYDVLYTRAPINYSGTSFVRRAICFLCLACSLCGFAILFRHADVQIFKILVSRKYDKKVDISITYLLLAGAITLELYALLTILCSDWSVLYLIKEQRNKFVDAALQVFAHKVSRPPRWSNQIQQLNMLHYCISKEPTVLNKILNKLIRRIPKNTPCAQLLEGWDQRYKRFRLTQSVGVDDTLKELIIKQIEEVRGQRVWQAFTKRGEWALERYKCLDQFKWSIGTDHTNEANQQTSFGRAITIWHLATDVCYGRESSESKSTNKELSKRLSDYMMYLLAVRPHMLSIGTGSILFQGASKKLGEFLSVIISSPTDAATKKGKTDEKTMIQHFLEKLLQKSSEETVVRVSNKHNNVEISAESEYVIISSWNLVLDAKLLSELLIDREDKWSLLCSIWTEMLFYAASNCPWVHHTEQLRRGGGLITFAWILLNHETNKFNISMY